MKIHFRLLFGVLITFLIASFSLLYAQENITITTFYPSPYGVYKDLETEVLHVNPRKEPPCECIPDNNGIMYYQEAVEENDENVFYFCNGEEWIPIGYEEELPETVLGGYYMGDAEQFLYATGSGNTRMENIWQYESFEVQKYDRISPFKDEGPFFGMKAQFRNMPRGNYLFEWSADLDVDQYPGPKNNINKALQASDMKVQIRTDSGWKTLDSSEICYDEDDKDLPTDPLWTTPDTYSTHHIERAFTMTYARANDKKNKFRAYRIVVNKKRGENYMRVRVRNARLYITYLE
ncbi:MAG: hypothetical protein JXD21_08215 [Candidatus Omnitrophica bacterium]|nr:hypothetical protein [Candidatus Omnitrophota bacterium]